MRVGGKTTTRVWPCAFFALLGAAVGCADEPLPGAVAPPLAQQNISYTTNVYYPSVPTPMRPCPDGMVRVPAGAFVMGADGPDMAQSSPPHVVTLGGYCIDRTEVTIAAYRQCASAAGCTPPPVLINQGVGNPPENVPVLSKHCEGNWTDRPSLPVNCIDWGQASAYCAWAHKRLPTEAEWEYAARGSDGRTYPWGNDEPREQRLRWTPGRGFSDPVGSFPGGASPFGALDMAGNVSEWVADTFAPYESGEQNEPTGPPGPVTHVRRVVRGSATGGSDPVRVRAALREALDPWRREIDVGFRCASAD